MQTGPIDPTLAAALPHALRIVQHHRAVASIIPQLATPGNGPRIGADLATELDAYRDQVAASLIQPKPPEPREGPDSPHAVAAQVETGYQRIKTALLVAAARGSLEPMTLDRLIMQVDRIRRTGEHAAKARQRFQRIEDALKGIHTEEVNDLNT
jgi:hypothetical protein